MHCYINSTLPVHVTNALQYRKAYLIYKTLICHYQLYSDGGMCVFSPDGQQLWQGTGDSTVWLPGMLFLYMCGKKLFIFLVRVMPNLLNKKIWSLFIMCSRIEVLDNLFPRLLSRGVLGGDHVNVSQTNQY